MGGTYGMAEAIAGATEHQAEGTPHFHGEIALVTPFQHLTLQEIADLIQRDCHQRDLVECVMSCQPCGSIQRPLSAYGIVQDVASKDRRRASL